MKKFIINDAKTEERIFVDDGSYRLSATSRAFHEEHPEESSYMVVTSVDYKELFGIPTQEGTEYRVAQDVIVFVPDEIKTKLNTDKLIEEALGKIAEKETVQVRLTDDYDNVVTVIRVKKDHEGLDFSIKLSDDTYEYPYYEKETIKENGIEYRQIIPLGSENSEAEFLKMYIPEEKIERSIIKKHNVFGLEIQYLPDSLFKEAEKIREERLQQFYEELLDKIETPPILNRGFEYKEIINVPLNPWNDKMDMRHLYTPDFVSKSVLLKAPKNIKKRIEKAYEQRLKNYIQIPLINESSTIRLVANLEKNKGEKYTVYVKPEHMKYVIGRRGENVKNLVRKYNAGFEFRELPSIKNVKKIVSHKNPRHMDDFLAIALLKAKAPDAVVEYVHPQSVPEEYKKDPTVALVDVGGKFDPVHFNYDHHQNVNAYPSSVVLVLVDAYKLTRISSPVISTIDYIDRFGYPAAKNKFGLKPNEEVQEKLKTVLMADLNDTETCKIVQNETLKVIGIDENGNYTPTNNNMTLDDFVEKLYKELKNSHKLDQAIRLIQEEKKGFERKIFNAETINLENLNVVVSKESFAPFHKKAFDQLNADLIIERNAMNPKQTSIIKNTSKISSEDIDLSKVFEKYPKVFIHGTGFIAVVDKSVDEIDPKAIVSLVNRNNQTIGQTNSLKAKF